LAEEVARRGHIWDPSADAYTRQYTTVADATIGAGFVTPEDRDQLVAYARPARVGG
jgi:hypothetical protein